MLERFNLAWPKMRQLKTPVYGKLILFAGAESTVMQDALYDMGIRNILVSYHYLKKQPKDKIRERLSKFDFVMLDSGAFTFIQRMNNGEVVPPEEIRQFTHGYLDFCEQMSDCFNWVVEMDVADRVSEEFYFAQQQEFLERGIRVLPVIHGKPLEWYREHGWFEKFDAMAIAGRLTGGVRGTLIPYLNECRKHNIIVHGLAATDTSSVERMPYFSCDSTTWLSGGKFGSTYIFKNGTLVTYDNTHKVSIREQYKDRFIKAGLDWDKIKADSSSEVNKMNAYSWFQWYEWIKYDTRQSYWLDDMEIAKAKELFAESRNYKLPVSPVKEATDVVRSDRYVHDSLIQIGNEDRVAFVDPRAVHVSQCNNCSLAYRCEYFEADAKCVYKINHAVTSAQDVMPLLGAAFTMQFDRLNQERLNEKYDGNRSSKELNEGLKLFFNMAEKMAGIDKTLNPVKNLLRGAAPMQPPNPGTPTNSSRSSIVKNIINTVIEVSPIEEDSSQ